ncbi:MarR family transcriptional regulator [Leucobacter sp. CSA2]|uniref:MarR family transcriptional regulator n=1 Tax=Leucobacter edaphi TaxID=2796472 RepID=A0A934QDM7_9MICO|nr:MarR family transcriptional regulator [Leucobacter edaphi]MBK0421891.1 MarR family transcriptional regulator [Leucobacter edaphi]
MADDLTGAWTRVAAFASAFDANLDRWLSEHFNLGLTEYWALNFMEQAPDRELRIAALAQNVGLTSTSTTRLVSRLEAKGLARRDVCMEDGRGVYAVIDDSGAALLREARDPFEARVRDLLGNPQSHFPHLNTLALRAAFTQTGDALQP